MSVIDTPPMDTMSAWATLRLQLDAERTTKAAAERAELDAQAPQPRTAADALRDVQRYTQMLTVPAVLASKHWTEDIETKLRVAKAELRYLRRSGGAL